MGTFAPISFHGGGCYGDLFLTFVVTSSLYRFLKIPFLDLCLTFVAHPRFSPE